MITTVKQPAGQFDRRSGKETDRLLDQLRKAANQVGSLIVSSESTGDSLGHILWTSPVIPQNSVIDLTVQARSCLATFADSGRFILDRSYVRGTGVASQSRTQDLVSQPIGAETIAISLSANNEIVITTHDVGSAMSWTAWIEIR